MKSKKIWASDTYSLQTKNRLFNALVKSVLFNIWMLGIENKRGGQQENGHIHVQMLLKNIEDKMAMCHI